MTVFIVFIVFLYLSDPLCTGLKIGGKKLYIVCACVFLFFLIGFRDYLIGVDTYGYMLSFKELSYIYSFSPKSILAIFAVKREPLYVLLNVIIASFTSDFTVLLCSYALLYVISVGVLVFRYSNNPRWSFLILLSLGFLYFAMSGIRQTIALSILLFSYKYIRERKLIPFLLIVLLAYGFHNTSIIFLLAYPLATVKVTWKHCAVLVIAYFVMTCFSNVVFFLLFNVLKWERLSSYENSVSTLSLSGALIQFSIFVFALVFKNSAVKRDCNNTGLINMAFLGCFFQLFTPVIAEFFRISMYFSIFNILMIPNVTTSIRIKNNKLLVGSAIPLVLLLYYFLFSGPDPTITPYCFVS